MNSESISRVDFPDGFIFGTASSAYQVMLFIFLNFNFFMIDSMEWHMKSCVVV